MGDPTESQLFLLPLFLLFFVSFPLLADPSLLVPIEGAIAKARKGLEEFDVNLSLRERRLLRETAPSEKARLEPRLRRLFEEREGLKGDLLYGERVLRLKRDLLDLQTGPPQAGVEGEAEAIARTAITAFGEIREHFQMVRPAVLHNFLVNARLKSRGFCWHWTRDLRERLLKLPLKQFELHWATAREGTLREHNTVVITARGRGIGEGLLLDGWRHSGEPFWTRVATDTYPWKPGAFAGEPQ